MDKEKQPETRYELILIALALVACAVIIIYNCLVREAIVTTKVVYEQPNSSSIIQSEIN
ncbi:MAG: hypothetical protein ACI4II_06495 [Acutalibacteraceae bacterium]